MGNCIRCHKDIYPTKKAIRSLCNLDYRESCRDSFKKEKILTLSSVYIYACLQYVHQNMDRYTRNSAHHTYPTRSAEDLQVPYHRLHVSQQGVDYWGTKLYNKLPIDVRRLEGSAFSTWVKGYLTQGCFYSVEEYMAL